MTTEVTLSDLKDMGQRGGYTIRLVPNFPVSFLSIRLRHQVIDMHRVGVANGKAVEVSFNEGYSKEWLDAIATIMHNKTLVAKRHSQTGKLVFTGKGYRHVE